MDIKKHGIRPEDILSDAQNTTFVDGINVRKGSVAAFLKNIDILENKSSTEEEKEGALHAMQELSPALRALNLLHYVDFKNKAAQDLLEDSI